MSGLINFSGVGYRHNLTVERLLGREDERAPRHAREDGERLEGHWESKVKIEDCWSVGWSNIDSKQRRVNPSISFRKKGTN